MTEQMCTVIDILRHGEPEGGSMYRGGGTDHRLSADGWEQMQHSIKHIESVAADMTAWSSIVTSPMLRCCEFAYSLGESRQLSVEVAEPFREAHYGEWEGRTALEIMQDSEQAYWDFFQDPVNQRPQGAESLAVLTARVTDAFTQLLADYQGQHILLVTHLGVIRAILGEILEMPLASQQRIDMPFAGVLRVVNDRRGTRLLFR